MFLAHSNLCSMKIVSTMGVWVQVGNWESLPSFKPSRDTVRFVFSSKVFFSRGCGHVMVTDHFHPLMETLSCPTYVTIFLQRKMVFAELFSIVIICDLDYGPVFIYFLQNRLPVNF